MRQEDYAEGDIAVVGFIPAADTDDRCAIGEKSVFATAWTAYFVSDVRGGRIECSIGRTHESDSESVETASAANADASDGVAGTRFDFQWMAG